MKIARITEAHYSVNDYKFSYFLIINNKRNWSQIEIFFPMIEIIGDHLEVDLRRLLECQSTNVDFGMIAVCLTLGEKTFEFEFNFHL